MIVHSSMHGFSQTMPWKSSYNLFFLSYVFLVDQHVGAALSGLHFWSNRIVFEDLSVQYPDSLWRQLTSATPRREFALKELSLELGSRNTGDLLLLTGDSESGKSTMLRLIQKCCSSVDSSSNPMISSGSIKCYPTPIPSNQESASLSATSIPIYLDSFPSFSSQRSVEDIVDERLKGEHPQSLEIAHSCFLPLLLYDVKAHRRKVCELSTSEVYLLEVALACAQSSRNRGSRNTSGPILLLDEWLDRESSQVVQRVQRGLELLVSDTKAVIVVVTHKPERWRFSNDHDRHRRLELNRGRVSSLARL